jgi:hypothetical protein
VGAACNRRSPRLGLLFVVTQQTHLHA